MRYIVLALTVLTLAGCGGPSEYARQENELAVWGDRIEIELRPADYDDPCSYYVSNVRTGGGLKLSADVTADCP